MYECTNVRMYECTPLYAVVRCMPLNANVRDVVGIVPTKCGWATSGDLGRLLKGALKRAFKRRHINGPKASGHFLTLLNASEHVRTHPNTSEHIRTCPNTSEHVQARPETSENA